MTDPRYAHIGNPTDRLIEECAELILAVQKARRFGWFGHHPDRPDTTNLDDVKREMDDVTEAIEALCVEMRQMKTEHFARRSIAEDAARFVEWLK